MRLTLRKLFKNGSIVTDYQYEQNNYSDSRFLKDMLGRSGVQDKEVTLVTYSSYAGKENHDLAAEKNIRLVNMSLSEKSLDDILADFVFNESGTKVLSQSHVDIPATNPSSSTYPFQRSSVQTAQTKTAAKPKSINASVP